MAQNEGHNVAIVALIVIAILVAGATFLYFQNDAGSPVPVEHRTIIEPRPPADTPQPEEEQQSEEEEPGFSFEHEDEEGKTKIETP